MKIFDSALKYLEQGFSIIPVSPTDKRPLVKWSEFQERIPSKEEVTEMFQKYPKAMCGLITGKVSGICVIDCDSPEACQKIDSMLPETFETPIAISPRCGRHYYFHAKEDMQTQTSVFRHVDIRAEGGVIVAPPSINSQGKQYRWLNDLELTKDVLQPMPPALASLLCDLKGAPLNKINNIYKNNKYIEDTQNRNRIVTGCEKLFEHGRRDNDLFHLALTLRRGGESPEYILQVLRNAALTWGEENEITWLSEKIESAFKHEEQKIEDISKALDEWILLQHGYFSVTSCYAELRCVTPQQKTALRAAILRRCEKGILEKHREKSGVYRRVDTSVEIINFLDTSGNDLDLKFPLGIESYYRPMPKNIIVVAGCPDSGKTALLLNFVALNMEQYEIFYFSSEMGAMELRDRLSNFDIPLDKWKCKFIERSSNFTDVIRPDAINVIDYMELCTDTFRIGEYLRAIHDKLKTGVALISLQKPFGRDLGRGAEFSLEKPRLYVSMEGNRMKIIKCKNWRDSQKNPNGLTIDYNLIAGCKFLPVSGWKRSD